MHKRLLLVILAIVVAIPLQGCEKAKVWYVDFTTVTNLDEWLIEEDAPYISTHDAEGLYIDGNKLTAPKGFTGDFVLTVVFTLDPPVGKYVNNFSISLTDGTTSPNEERIKAAFMNVGDDAIEHYSLIEEDPYAELASGTGIAGINRTGTNTFIMTKEGNNLKLHMNTTQICSVFCSSYSNIYSFPVLYINDQMDERIILIKSIKVEYEGEMFNRPV
ncbi:MAG TPA: hypothetical protein PLT03_02050 [Bacillota bacterium]|nr:hypothetical protein [Bacillota bacterium]HOG52633.1 hypothetical protein [Bacillota bacterium]